MDPELLGNIIIAATIINFACACAIVQEMRHDLTGLAHWITRAARAAATFIHEAIHENDTPRQPRHATSAPNGRPDHH